jgi:quaternary ammonium compound-resistance protein SugE
MDEIPGRGEIHFKPGCQGYDQGAAMSAWIILVLAGLLETAWAIGLKYTVGFSRPLPTALTLAAIVASMWLLGIAARTLPIGTAYAVWVGIGALGAAVLGVILFKEPVTAWRVVFLTLLLVAIIGLRLTAPSACGKA